MSDTEYGGENATRLAGDKTFPWSYYTYNIPGMEVEPGPMIFTLVSQFISLITPDDLPLEQIREVLYYGLSWLDFATNSIRVEAGILGIAGVFLILALIPLITACAWCCCKGNQDEIREDLVRASSSVVIVDETLQTQLRCRRKASVTTLWICFLLLAFSDVCIFYANSRLASSVDMAPEMLKSTIHDLEVFFKDTHSQIKYKLDNGFHVSVEKVVKDLEDVDVLLGQPIQSEIASNTGIELAYDSLTTISLSNAELIYRVLMLQETVGRALKIAQEAAARMEELQIQLSVLQRQCTYRDRPLCDTLRIRSFEENGIIDALKTLQEDQTIFRMRYLGEIEFGATVKNLTSEVGMSRSIFNNFPQQIKHDTSYQRNYTMEQLDSIRKRTTSNVRLLTNTVNSLSQSFDNIWELFNPAYAEVTDWADKYWTIGWIIAMVIVAILFFMILAYCCSLSSGKGTAGVMLFITIIIICLTSLVFMIYGIATLAVGGNSEIFLCRYLYDNDYETLGKLVDKPGYLYAEEPENGIIAELLRPNKTNNSIVNVTLAEALRRCEQDEETYNVFQLDAFVNTTKIADHKQFPKVKAAIDDIDVSERTLLSLTQTIQNILENMLLTSSFNLTTYRVTIGAPTPEKDLATFIEQMQRVALQIQDVATSSRMTTLGSRAKRLQASILQPLEQLQNEILYHLTALELQRDPWAKQVNQTLNHLKNVQGYLEKNAGEICLNQTRNYTQRLKNYLTSSKATISSQLGDTTAKCRRFFDIYDANRTFLCRNIVDYMSGLWFFTFVTLLLWSICTPVALNLINTQKKLTNMQRNQTRRLERSESRGRGSERDLTRGARDRSTSSTRRAAAAGKPPLRRSATEETLDIETESTPRLDNRSQRDPRSREREMGRERDVSRERDMSRTREMSRSREAIPTISATTPSRLRGQLRRSGTDEEEMDDNWGASTLSRASSRDHDRNRDREWQREQERERERERQREMEFERQRERTRNRQREASRNRSVDRESQQSQRRVFSSIMQRGKPKPVLKKQKTEEEMLEMSGNWSSSQNLNKTADRNRQKRGGPDKSRSVTPVLSARADAQAATPKPRTPTHLKNRVSLTTRQVQDIVANRNRRLNRMDQDDFDMNDSDIYATQSNIQPSMISARGTPPRGAPPPPPPPGTGISNRFYQRY